MHSQKYLPVRKLVAKKMLPFFLIHTLRKYDIYVFLKLYGAILKILYCFYFQHLFLALPAGEIHYSNDLKEQTSSFP